MALYAYRVIFLFVQNAQRIFGTLPWDSEHKKGRQNPKKEVRM